VLQRCFDSTCLVRAMVSLLVLLEFLCVFAAVRCVAGIVEFRVKKHQQQYVDSVLENFLSACLNPGNTR
jgi:hypothetical protein